MARVLGLEEVSPGLKSALGSCLRVYDEAVVLPQAHRSTESGGFKNVAIKLSGTEGELTSELFSPNWFSGVSALQIPTDIAEPLIKDPRKRATALAKLVALIPSEMEGAEVQVGPELDGDEHDRDTAPWEAGFDSPGCCVGLYSAQQSRAPDLQVNGMHRIHNTYFLVCKAGGGAAAQTFHSRLVAALGQGQSLDECLKQGESPGPQGLRRVSLAAQRNRARILELAARAIGYHALDTIPDNASSAGYRMAVTTLNVQTNVLREAVTGGWHYAAGCVDAASSQGLLSSSNPHEGFVVFTDSNAGYKINLRNPAYNCLPFSSYRLGNNRDSVMAAADKHKKAIMGTEAAHPDAEWIRERFGWKAKQLGVDIEPPPLWGTYGSEEYITAWGRELGISQCRVMRLQPEIVSIAAVEPAKLRAAAKHVQKGGVGAVGLS
jgi:hypothetical protein